MYSERPVVTPSNHQPRLFVKLSTRQVHTTLRRVTTLAVVVTIHTHTHTHTFLNTEYLRNDTR